MDKNTVIGILLIIAIIIGFSIFNKPGKKEIEAARRRQDSIEKAERSREKEIASKEANAKNQAATLSSDSAISNSPDSVRKHNTINILGSFAGDAEGKKQFFTIENDLIKVRFCSKGGRIYSVQLKKYKTFDGGKLILFDGDSTVFGLNFFAQNRNISTNELFFLPMSNDTDIIVKNASASLALRLPADSGKYLEYVYTLLPNSYKLKMDINFFKMNTLISDNSNYVTLKWEAEIPGQERGRDFENNYTGIYFKYLDDEVDYLSQTSSDEKNLRTQVKMDSI